MLHSRITPRSRRRLSQRDPGRDATQNITHIPSLSHHITAQLWGHILGLQLDPLGTPTSSKCILIVQFITSPSYSCAFFLDIIRCRWSARYCQKTPKSQTAKPTPPRPRRPLRVSAPSSSTLTSASAALTCSSRSMRARKHPSINDV